MVVVTCSSTHCLLGNTISFSGILYRTSLSALTLHNAVVKPTIATAATAVLAFQFLGCPYQPPAGDQTCFGYGILSPPPMVPEVEPDEKLMFGG